jgi:phosphoribosylformylglycinamidine synthase
MPYSQHSSESPWLAWRTPPSQIGEVTDSGRVQYYMNEVLEADIPAESLVLGGGAPIYKREWSEPKYFADIAAFNMDQISIPEDLKAVAHHLMAEPNIASKRWVFNRSRRNSDRMECFNKEYEES